MNSSESTPCPGRYDDIAAMVDGRLTAAERDNLEEHLADCELCLELLAETTALVHAAEPGEDDDLDGDPDAASDGPAEILPFVAPAPSRGRSLPKPWIAAAATGLLAAALLPLFGSNVTDAALIASLGSPTALQQLVDSPLVPTNRDRGPGWQAQRSAAVQLGALRVRLQWALENGSPKAAFNLADEILTTAGDLGSSSADGPAPWHEAADGIYQALEAGASPQDPSVLDAVRRFDKALAELPSPASRYLDLGRWIESGRLATAASSTDALTSKARRRLWEDLEPFLAGEAAPFELAEARDLEDGPLDDDALASLSRLYERALIHYLLGPSTSPAGDSPRGDGP